MKPSLKLGMIVAGSALAACQSVPFDQPDIPLPSRYAEGAMLTLRSFEGADGLTTPTQGDALTILKDQIGFGLVRCSRPGPPLDVNIRTRFAEEPANATGHRLVGVAEWRDSADGRLVGRHQVDLSVDLDDRDWRMRGQLEGGERLIGGLCPGGRGTPDRRPLPPGWSAGMRSGPGRPESLPSSAAVRPGFRRNGDGRDCSVRITSV